MALPCVRPDPCRPAQDVHASEVGVKLMALCIFSDGTCEVNPPRWYFVYLGADKVPEVYRDAGTACARIRSVDRTLNTLRLCLQVEGRDDDMKEIWRSTPKPLRRERAVGL